MIELFYCVLCFLHFCDIAGDLFSIKWSLELTLKHTISGLRWVEESKTIMSHKLPLSGIILEIETIFLKKLFLNSGLTRTARATK